MRLEAFSFIDDAMVKISENLKSLEWADLEIKTYLESLFVDMDCLLNVNSRVKSANSVKEKILRQNLYIKHRSVEELLDALPDIIGVRLECRFIKDEEKIYKKLKELFNIQKEEGFYTSSGNDRIVLKLDEKQPQTQQNGFDIYKIDGYYLSSTDKYNFELQIKSMVNLFWGDIEHKILYKNYSYLLGEDFITDMMHSINDNLTLIDRQLMVVYDHVYENEPYSGTYEEIKEVLKKAVYDKYFIEIRENLGFVVDFRSLVDLVVDYVFFDQSPEGEDELGADFIKILSVINEVDTITHGFDTELSLQGPITFEKDPCSYIGERLLVALNKDFRWNLLFRIIFELTGLTELSREETFKRFVQFLVQKFEKVAYNATINAPFKEEEKKLVYDEIMKYLVRTFYKIPNVEYFDSQNFKSLETQISSYIRSLGTYANFERNKGALEDIIISNGL